MSTNKDCIERLEADVLELKEAMRKVTIESKMEESLCELRELIFQTPQKDNNDQGSISHSIKESSVNSSGPRVTSVENHMNMLRTTKLNFLRYARDDPKIWLD